MYYFDQKNESVNSHLLTLPSKPFHLSLPHHLTIFFCLQVTTKYLNGLIELIHSNLAGNQQDSASVEASRKHFLQTLEIIRSKEYEGIVLTPK